MLDDEINGQLATFNNCVEFYEVEIVKQYKMWYNCIASGNDGDQYIPVLRENIVRYNSVLRECVKYLYDIKHIRPNLFANFLGTYQSRIGWVDSYVRDDDTSELL